MQIAIQVLVVILEVLACMQKKKSTILLFYTIDNATLALMYFLFNRYTTALICLLALVRTIVFMLFSLKNKKPNIYVLLLFEVSFIVTTAVFWQDALDLLPMFGSMASCYASWQDKTSILRIGFIINPLFYTIYKCIIKTYIAIIPEVILLLSNLITLIYYNILKKEKPIMEYLGFCKKQKSELNVDTKSDVIETSEVK